MTSRIDAALDMLARSTTDAGMLASPDEVDNYRRVWCRDGIICGLAGLVSGRPALVDGMEATLRTLASAQGPDGQIPSNVRVENGEITDVSYGGVAGRIDTSGWFVVGAIHHAEVTGDPETANDLLPVMERALDLYNTWEFNRRGLVYMPQGGDWADEYVLHGYVLYVQLLRLWALRSFARFTDDEQTRSDADALQRRLERNFWPDGATDPDECYHARALREFLGRHGEPDHWLAALSPGGYVTQFDGWSNALAVLLGLGSDAQQQRVLETGREIAEARAVAMVPAFWPPITPGDADWPALLSNCSGSFDNDPGRYHNGGLWPVVNGWWGMALEAAGRHDEARALADHIDRANRALADASFPEYLDARDGSPCGVIPCTWSAAATVLLDSALDGSDLNFTPD